MSNMTQEKTEYDVIVVGSGGGALLTANRAHDLGLSVLVLEKSDQYGGTSAVSGGAIWIPNNDQIGPKDSLEEARTYIKASARGMVTEARLEAYLDSAPKMVRYITEKTQLRYASCQRYPDYYQDLPGSKPGGRTMDPELFDASLLGDEYENMRASYKGTLLMGKVAMTASQAQKLLAKESGWPFLFMKMMARYYLDFPWRLKTKRDRRLSFGNALIGGLRHAMLQRNIPLWLNTPFESLLQENGRVTGVIAKRNGQSIQLTAKRGVVFAAGGFERNQQMREQYLPQPTNAEWSATPPHNTGDTLRAGIAIGAKTDLMNWAWWVPSMHVPGDAAQTGLFVGRAFPGCVAVNSKGKRFVRESAPYLEFGVGMYEDHAKSGSAVPAWLVFDAKFRFNYPIGPLMPGQIAPDRSLPKSWLGQVYWKDETLEGLSKQIGVDTNGLRETVNLNNQYAKTGVDKEFGNGGNLFDRYYGDSNVKPNPCLGPISKGPFYAIRMDAGDIGTKGGLLTDEHARVLDQSNQPIAGLFCIGNNSSSVMGPSYPGAGGTLGPAMTFGFRAANFMAES